MERKTKLRDRKREREEWKRQIPWERQWKTERDKTAWERDKKRLIVKEWDRLLERAEERKTDKTENQITLISPLLNWFKGGKMLMLSSFQRR